MSSLASRRWQLHQHIVAGRWSAAAIGERWRATFASLPEAPSDGAALAFSLVLVDEVPAAPTQTPDFKQGDLLAYYQNAQ